MAGSVDLPGQKDVGLVEELAQQDRGFDRELRTLRGHNHLDQSGGQIALEEEHHQKALVAFLEVGPRKENGHIEDYFSPLFFFSIPVKFDQSKNRNRVDESCTRKT